MADISFHNVLRVEEEVNKASNGVSWTELEIVMLDRDGKEKVEYVTLFYKLFDK